MATLTDLDAPPPIEPVSPLYRRMNLSLFTAGVTTFSLLYFVQPLLPVFATEFGVTPASSSLTLSATTGVMAFALFFSGVLSDRLGRKRIMTISLVASALLTLAMALMPGWNGVLACRLLMGVTLSGVQGIAMAYLSEEIALRHFGMSMGLFISGGAFGGLLSRLVAGVLADVVGWRAAAAVIGLAALVAAGAFAVLLPPSTRFRRTAPGLAALRRGLEAILSDGVFLTLFTCGFLLMGGFVSLYNYVTFRLVAPPFSLPHVLLGLVFGIYATGIVGSTWVGEVSSRIGRRAAFWRVIAAMLAGALLTLPQTLWAVIPGLALMTFGFFSAHSVASGWVSARARTDKALAASLYLFSYYMGSSLVGSAGGLFWQSGGWPAVVALTGSLAMSALALALSLRRTSG